ncbi:MAG: RHS repeat-associated core domain-containing protein [Flavobacteriales bacterium]
MDGQTEFAKHITFYVRDASGNVMAVYEHDLETPESYHLSERHIYGSSRIGMITEKVEYSYTYSNNAMVDINENEFVVEDRIDVIITTTLGYRQYELSNHLGNVLSVIGDQKLPIVQSGVVQSFVGYVISSQDYSPFGVTLSGRGWRDESYRYGFQNQETDEELWGGAISFKYRVEDTRLGRFFSVDPLAHKFNFYSPYHFCSNSPIATIESEGLEGYNANDGLWNSTKIDDSAIPITKDEYLRVKNWYATNGGMNNPEKLVIQKPEEKYDYIFVPYDDPNHPEVTGQGNMSESNDGVGKGPDADVQSSEMAGFWYRQRIVESTATNTSGSSLTGTGNINNQSTDNSGSQTNLNQNNQLNANNILPFVPGGRGLNRDIMRADGYIPLMTTQRTGRINILMQPSSNDGTAVNPTVTVSVLRNNGAIQVLGVLNNTGAIGYSLNTGDQLLYMSTGGSNTGVTYTETR